MAKNSPKKGSSKKDNSNKDSKDSLKKSGADKNKKNTEKRIFPKWSAEECVKADLETFARKRYEAPMDASYKRVAFNIALIVKKIHIFEVFNDVPSVQQFCNSNKSKGSPKSKSGSPKEKAESKNKKNVCDIGEVLCPEYEEPIIEGVVAIRRPLLLQADQKLFIEVTATLKYGENSLVTPFLPKVRVQKMCYRDYYYVQPTNYERVVQPTEYNQSLITKIRLEYGAEWDGYPFSFSLIGTPDSITFNRPYSNKDPENGIFWEIRCFIGKHEFIKCGPGREVRMNFWKFTIGPSLVSRMLRKSYPSTSSRFQTLDDVGDLCLSASLNRDIFYHENEIIVTINVENNSQRHVIESITVFCEQNYRFYCEIPHDNSITLEEVWLKSGDAGLPINPKSKNWSKTVSLKAKFDWSKYNLVTDGKMERDEKIFLASSTIIMKSVPLSPEEIEKNDEKLPKTKGSPDKQRTSDKKISLGRKGPPEKKGSPDKRDSPGKRGSADKKEKSSPKVRTSKKEKDDKSTKVEEPDVEKLVDCVAAVSIPTKKVLTNRDLWHPVFVSYDIVVRLNMKSHSEFEAGHSQVRVPFILTRETRCIDKWSSPPNYSHRPIICNDVHTMKSQGHPFCTKLDKIVSKDTPQSNRDSPKKDNTSPKTKSKSTKK